MLFFPLLEIFLPYIIFFLIILLLEIDLINDIKSPMRNIGRMIYKFTQNVNFANLLPV